MITISFENVSIKQPFGDSGLATLGMAIPCLILDQAKIASLLGVNKGEDLL